MAAERDIVEMVKAAQSDPIAADDLVRRYQPFIRSQAARFYPSVPEHSREDLCAVAMMAFHQAAMAYDPERGAFLPLAAQAIYNRCIDVVRMETRHRGTLSLEEQDQEDGRTRLETLDLGHDPVGRHTERRAAQAELGQFIGALAALGLCLTDIADNCPRQDRTLAACHRALHYARSHPELLHPAVATGKLPIRQLAQGSGVSAKTLERHRRYMLALLLAYTNGFEIIRGHLRQIAPGKGGI